VAEHVDVQLVGHVPDQFHEELTFVHHVELLPTKARGERPGEQTGTGLTDWLKAGWLAG
jgi:hypothetical protein